MLDRLILSVALTVTGYHGLYPDPPAPLSLKEKAKEKSVSAVCLKKKKQSETVKALCRRWKQHKGTT